MSKHSQKNERETLRVLVGEYAGDMTLTPAGLSYLGLVPQRGKARVIPFQHAEVPSPKAILRAS